MIKLTKQRGINMFKDYSKFMGYAVLTIVILGAVFGGMRLLGVFGERVAFENSLQYKKGMESRALTLQAQIAEVEMNIMKSPEMRETLEMQKKVLMIQLQATQL